jgi:O-antigen ligase
MFSVAYADGGYSLSSRSTIAVAVWWTILVGVAVGVWPVARLSRVAFIPALLLAALAGWDLASAAWSASAERAFAEFDRTALYLGIYVLVVLASRPGRLLPWIDGLTIAIVATAAVALTSRFAPGTFPARGLANGLPGSSTRLSFPVDYWNGLGTLVGVAIPLLLCRVAGAGRARRLVSIGVVPALGAVVYLTSSRGAVAAIAAGVAVLVVAHPRRRAILGAALVAAGGAAAAAGVLSTRHAVVDGPLGSAAARTEGRQAALAVIAICIVTALAYEALGTAVSRLPAPGRLARTLLAVSVAGLLAAAGIYVGRSLEGFTGLPPGSDSVGSHLLSGSGAGRWQFWTAAIGEFRRHPLLGGGAGSFEAWWDRHGSFAYVVRDAHSLPVETLAELGLVGFTILAAFIGSALWIAIDRLRRARGGERAAIGGVLGALTVYLLGAAVDWMWELTVVTAAGMVVIGLLAGPASAVQTVAAREGPEVAWPRRSVAALAAGAIVAAELVVLLAALELGASQADARAGMLPEARAAALGAAKVEPWAATPYLQLALVEEGQGDLGAARQAIDRSLARDAGDWRSWLVKARIENGLGEYASGALSLARARTLNPRSPLVAGDRR